MGRPKIVPSGVVVGPRGAKGEQGEPGPSGGPFPDLDGVDSGQVARTTGGGGVEFVDLAAAVGAVRPEDFGAFGPNVDSTVDMQACWDAAAAFGANVLYTSGQTYRADGQLNKPAGHLICVAAGASTPHFADAGSFLSNGPILDLRYTGAGQGIGAGAKIQAKAAGIFRLDGITITDKGTSSNLWINVTYATPQIQRCYFEGNAAKELATCDQDVIRCGGTLITQGSSNPEAAFSGYGGWIKDNQFARIRRGVQLCSSANAINVIGNSFAVTCGSNAAALGTSTFAAPTTSTTGGSLAAATYYYVVTAFNRTGEALKSNEVTRVTTGSTSTVSLSWSAVSGAMGYRVYRSTSTGTENFLVETTATTFTDTGSITQPASPWGPPILDQTNVDAAIVCDGWGREPNLGHHTQGNVIRENTFEIFYGYHHGLILRNNARKNVVTDNGYWDAILPGGGGKYVSDVLCDESSGAIENTLGLTGYSSPITSGRVPVTGRTGHILGGNYVYGPQSETVSGGAAFEMGTRNAGNTTFSNDVWAPVTLHKAVKVAAVAGDVLEIGFSGFVTNEASWLYLEACTWVSSAIVNYCSRQVAGGTGSTGFGVISWATPPSAYGNPAGSIFYTVQAGDISGGQVEIKLHGRLAAGVTTPTKSLFGTGGHNPYLTVKNLG